MRCEYSLNGNKCSREATKVLKTSAFRYSVCAKHYRKWKQMINGSMLSPNGAARKEEKEEYGFARFEE